MPTLLLATRNLHKVQEIRAILGNAFQCLSLADFPNAPEVKEDALTFAGNATKKAVQLARWLAKGQASLPDPFYVVADDSGLEVDALNGAPGVHSARFAAQDAATAGNTPDPDNNAKLLRHLKDVPEAERQARFRCVIALTQVLSDTVQNSSPVCAVDELEFQIQLFEGTCEGRIAFAPSGKGGFGYDPLFITVGHEQTFAELGESTKNQISHRAQALAKLHQRLEQV